MKKIMMLSLAILSLGIANAQKVGINTTSPDSILTVIGSTRISGNTLIGGNLKLPTGAGAGKVLRSDAGGNASWSAEAGMPTGTAAGQMLYWNGTAWVTVAPGPDSKELALCNGVPTWGGCPTSLTTSSVITILDSTASSGGNITDTGGYQIVARGVCYGTTLYPTIAGTKTNNGAGAGSFTSNLTGLTPGIIHYARSYATNSAGATSYGETRAFTPYPSIGSLYGGGKLYYFLQPGDVGYSPSITHGLVAYTTNGTNMRWSPGFFVTGAADSLVGYGTINTQKIYTKYGNDFNCAGCQAYLFVSPEFSDWLLPSKEELAKMYQQRQAIGGFTTGNYWSSTESDANNAWLQNFGNGDQSTGSKMNINSYRVIRRF